jgi:hypothetical protein
MTYTYVINDTEMSGSVSDQVVDYRVCEHSLSVLAVCVNFVQIKQLINCKYFISYF